MNLFAEVGAQELEHVRLNPADIELWPGNARRQELLNAANCSDLIESIAREGGNRIPVIVRRIGGERPFELIAGTRRHFAVSYLRLHDYPRIQLLAQVMQLTNQEAFRISEVENSARADVSAVERARSYAWALNEVYRGKQLSLAEALGKSKSWVSKMLAIARIPDEVLSAFRSPADLDFKPAYNLAKALADEEQRPRILEKAREVANEQIALGDVQPIPAEKVVQRLLQRKAVSTGKAICVWRNLEDRPYLTFKKHDAEGLHVIVHEDNVPSLYQLNQAFEECWDMRRRREGEE